MPYKTNYLSSKITHNFILDICLFSSAAIELTKRKLTKKGLKWPSSFVSSSKQNKISSSTQLIDVFKISLIQQNGCFPLFFTPNFLHAPRWVSQIHVGSLHKTAPLEALSFSYLNPRKGGTLEGSSQDSQVARITPIYKPFNLGHLEGVPRPQV